MIPPVPVIHLPCDRLDELTRVLRGHPRLLQDALLVGGYLTLAAAGVVGRWFFVLLGRRGAGALLAVGAGAAIGGLWVEAVRALWAEVFRRPSDAHALAGPLVGGYFAALAYWAALTEDAADSRKYYERRQAAKRPGTGASIESSANGGDGG